MSGISPSNVKAILSDMKWLEQRHTRRVFATMQYGADIILFESQKLVPIETGALHNSGKVTKSARDFTVTISYGDDKAYYALYVHEDPTKAHGTMYNAKYAYEISMGQKHPKRPEEQYKFLEKVCRERLNYVRYAMRKEYWHD